jgi:hypothetical protein
MKEIHHATPREYDDLHSNDAARMDMVTPNAQPHDSALPSGVEGVTLFSRMREFPRS